MRRPYESILQISLDIPIPSVYILFNPFPNIRRCVLKRILSISLVVILSLSGMAGAQSLRDNPRVGEAIRLLELWLDAQRAYEEIPGISISVVHDQEMVWSAGFGYADIEKKIPTTSKTIYSICSISKLFTSISVMQLRDAGKLRLDDHIDQILPWFTIKQAYPDSPPITVKGLLTHSAGMPRESAHPYWTGPDYPFPTREEMIKELSGQKTWYPAFERFQYSNLGMSILGEVVAQVSGQDYATYVKEHILDPVELVDTQPKLPDGAKKNRLALGYSSMTRQGVRVPLNTFQAGGIAPAAGFSSTAEDLGKFASWQFRVLENKDNAILHVHTLKEMQRVNWVDPDWKTSWGLGFSVSRNKDRTFVGHGGSCPGYQTQLKLNPKDKIAVVVMANASGVNTGKFAQQAYDIFAPAIAEALDTTKTAKVPPEKLKEYLGTYGSQPFGGEMAVFIWKGQLATVRFPSDEPLERITKWKHVEGDRFIQDRKDGATGMDMVFERDAEGKVFRIKRNNNYSTKMW